MPTISEQLTQLISDRDDLVDNLTTKGISGLTGDETFTELVPEVLNISGGGSSGVTFDNVSYGLTQPSASNYKYWIPVDTTKQSKPLKMVPKCTLKDTLQNFTATDLTVNNDASYEYINYTSSNMIRTKDYIASYAEERTSLTNFTIYFYERNNKDNNTFNIMEPSLTGNAITVNKSNCFSDIYSTAVINYAVNTARNDNYIYFIYLKTSSTIKMTRYDLSTQNLTNMGEFFFNQSTDSIIGTCKYLSLYVVDDTKFYLSMVTYNNSTYKLNLLRLTSTPNPGYARIFSRALLQQISNYGNSDYVFNKLDNRYLAVGSIYSTNTQYIFDMDNETAFMSSTGLKTEIQSSLTNLVNGATLTSSYYKYYNTPSNKIMVWIFQNGIYYGMYFFKISSNGTTYSIIPQLLLNASQENTLLLNDLTKIVKYDLTQNKIYYYLNSINIIQNNAMKYLYSPNGVISISATVNQNANTVCENISCVHQNLTSENSTNNVIIPIIAYEDYIRQSFYKFYLDENDNYTVVPVDDMGFKLPAFYNNARYDIYVSNGTNWTDTVSSSDSDYISS